GIESRHICREETGLELAAEAARQSLIGISPESIDLVIVATATPDMIVPSMGALVKRELGLKNAVAFDVNTACSGFIYAVWMAEALMKSGAASNGATNQINRALIIGVERLSRIVNWKDRGTCIIFGDGAGSAVLQLDENKKGIIGSFIKNYDDVSNSLTCGIEYLKTPFHGDNETSDMYLKMNGTQVFKFAVKAVEEVMKKVFEQTGVTPDEVAYFIPHQANMRIITAAAQRFKQPIEKFQVNIQTTGNVSAASVPMVLSDLMESGKVKPGDKLMMVGFGGGLSAGAILFEV
ncbi:MAG: beta-ketoacyl-ACP synthase 3, partial [Anaerovorax sp.]